MTKPKTWTAYLKGTLPDHGEVIQRMTFQAADKDDARDFAEREAAREAEGVIAAEYAGADDAERRRLVRARTFKVVRVEQQ